MNNRTVLIGFAVALLVLYVLMFVMLIVVMKRTGVVNSGIQAGGTSARKFTKLSAPNQTDFFNRSLQYAQKVLWGKEPFTPIAGNSESWLVGLALKMNKSTKEQVNGALQYSLMEPATAQSTETRLRTLAINQGVPLWFAILANAVNKVVPMQLAGTLSLPSAVAGANSPQQPELPTANVSTNKTIENNEQTIETLQTPNLKSKRKRSPKTPLKGKIIQLNATA